MNWFVKLCSHIISSENYGGTSIKPRSPGGAKKRPLISNKVSKPNYKVVCKHH